MEKYWKNNIKYGLILARSCHQIKYAKINLFLRKYFHE